MLKSFFAKPAHRKTLGKTRKFSSIFTAAAVTLASIAIAPIASAADPYTVERSGNNVTITVDCNLAISGLYTNYKVDVYRGENITFTSKTNPSDPNNKLCTNLTVRSSDRGLTGSLATGIFASPFPSTFTNIMLQQAPQTGSYTASVLPNAPIGAVSKPLAISNLGTTGIMMYVAVVSPAPVITSVAPNIGSITGGTQITITGTSFAAGATVTIGGVACANVVVVSETTITCTTPATTVGAKDVVVKNSDGRTGSAIGGFTYRSIAGPTTSNTTDFYADLDGVDTWFESAADQGPIPSTGDFTLEFWIYDPSARTSTNTTILSQSGADENKTFEIQIDKFGYLNQELVIKYGGQTYRSLMKLPQDRWVNVNLARSGETLFLNFDGHEVFNVDTNHTNQEILGKLFVGQSGSGSGKYEGRVDQIKIWNGVMSGANLEKSMHTWGAQDVQTGLSLVAHYDFNDKTIAGGQVYNKAANSYHLVLNAPDGSAPFVDVKQTITTLGKTTYYFPRTYLTQLGGWRVPNGIIAIQEALAVGGGGAGAYDGASGGGGGGSQFGSIPALTANQVLSVKVGQGGVPGNFVEGVQGTDGQASTISIPGRVIATAGSGGKGPGTLGSTTRGAGGSSTSFLNFENFPGGDGGLGVQGPTPAESGRSGKTLASNFDQSYSFGGGGGGGISAGAVVTAGTSAAIGRDGGGEGASTGAIGTEKYYCAGATSGAGASAGGNATANTGGGGGGGTASGDNCAAVPNTRYDGERTAGGHGGSGVVIFSVTTPAQPAPAPTYTVVATDNGIDALTASWPTMANGGGVGLRKIVQYRVGNGSWFQVAESTTATSYSMPRNINGVVEFRVSLFDEASDQWGEWVYSNQLEVTLYAGQLCDNPMKLTYDTSAQAVSMRFLNSLRPISIRWGDGTGVSSFTTINSTTATLQSKSFTSPGTYTIEVCGRFQSFTTTGANLVSVSQWGEWSDDTDLISPPARSLSGAFIGATRLAQVPADFPANVTNASSLFSGAMILNDPNLANWNVANVTNMESMFSGAAAFDQDISGWNVQKVTNMSKMFSGASSFNRNLAGWQTPEVTNFSRMFFYAKKYSFKPPVQNIVKANTATEMLDYSGISDVTYSQTILDWEALAPGVDRPASLAALALGAADKTALCSIPGELDSPQGKLLDLIADGWTVIDKTGRAANLCDTTITITANSTTQVYGDPVPSVGFTPTVDGPRNMDPTWVDYVSCSVELTSDSSAVAQNSAPARAEDLTYKTVCTGPASAGTGIDVVYVNGTHEITPRPISIQVKNRVEKKGSAWTTATTSLSSDTDLSEYVITDGHLIGDDAISVKITKGSQIGTSNKYELGGELVDAGESERYTVAFTSGVLTISNKTYVITADNRTKIYGDSLTLDNATGWSCLLEQGGSGTGCDAGLAGKTVALTTAGAAEDAAAGTYSISSSVTPVLSGDDYEIVNTNGGSLTVTKRPLYVTPNDLIVNAGSATPDYTFDLAIRGNSLLDYPNSSDGFVAPTCSSGYTPNSTRGTVVAITCSGGSAGDNFYFVFETGTLQVPEFTKVENLTPEQANASRSTGMSTVPFVFNVNPFLDVCYATLIVTDQSAEGIETIERRVVVNSSDLRFDLELPLGSYTYELKMDGNCSVDSNSSSLTVAARAKSGGPVQALPQPQSISPSVAKPNTRTKARITGESLSQVVTLLIGGKSVPIDAANENYLEFKIPKLKPGLYDIVLVMLDGTTQSWKQSLNIASASIKSKTFKGFASGSSKLKPYMTLAIAKYLKANKSEFKKIKCVGYTEGPVVKRTDVPLAMNRAAVVCYLASTYGYKVVSRTYVTKSTPGAEYRRVKVILKK